MPQTSAEAPVDAVAVVPANETDADTSAQAADELVEQDLLVEDVSIDGMCGVY